MPRAIRHEYDGAVYHVMCRGNNGQSIFEPARSDGFSSAPVAVVKKAVASDSFFQRWKKFVNKPAGGSMPMC
jgi:hypothetical protein